MACVSSLPLGVSAIIADSAIGTWSEMQLPPGSAASEKDALARGHEGLTCTAPQSEESKFGEQHEPIAILQDFASGLTWEAQLASSDGQSEQDYSPSGVLNLHCQGHFSPTGCLKIFFVSRALVSLSLSVTGKKRREG